MNSPESAVRTAQDKNSAPLSNQQDYIRYIREKTDQLLEVMGTRALQPEELDDQALIGLDPIGIVANSFRQIIGNLNRTIDELREAKNELQAIFDATGVGISIIDNDFVIQRYNKKQSELLVDPQAEDVVGKHCYEVYSNRCSPTSECPARDSFATGKTAVVREVWKKGRCFQVVTTPFSRSATGQVNSVIEVSMEITEKKVAEAAEKDLREFCINEKMKLATIIENLSEGLLVLDKSNRVVSWNRAADEVTRWLTTDMHDQPISEVFPELAILDKMASGSLHGIDFVYRNGKGDDRLLSANIGLLEDSEGSPIGKILTFRDNTEARKTTDLYHRAEKLAAIGQLSAGVAHELNTPLGSVLGYARLLLKDRGLTLGQRHQAEIIVEQAKKSSLIIQGLLRFARQSSQPQRRMEACQVNDIVRQTLPLLVTEISKRNIELTTDLRPVATITADPREIEQIVLNLTMNAIQAIASRGKVLIKTHQVAERVLLTISDDGPGVPEAIRSRIFDPFYTTKPVGEGTGLGLSICSGIVSDLGGSIEVDSVEGKGSAFTVTFLTPDRSRTVVPPACQATAASGSQRSGVIKDA
ncbi:MAG: ATP-binding protein [Pelovirga sp.]